MDKRPIIAITPGDPAGIGTEITVSALKNTDIYKRVRPLVICDKRSLENALWITESNLSLTNVSSPSEGLYHSGNIDYIPIDGVRSIEPGVIKEEYGQASYNYIENAVELAIDGKVDAITTGPINKESLRAADVPYIGHTEILGGLTGIEDPLTMFETRELRVFFLSRHVSLKNACDMVTYDRVTSYIKRCILSMEQLGLKEPSLAVAGLNPHSGEHGLFGTEEVEAVSPAVIHARKEGYNVQGPIGADSVFHLALNGAFTAVLSLYHDQGHIAAKTLDFYRTVSLTLGLPFLRTSVDHGTAFDLAGTGKANPVSMTEAILVAGKYAKKRGGGTLNIISRNTET